MDVTDIPLASAMPFVAPSSPVRRSNQFHARCDVTSVFRMQDCERTCPFLEPLAANTISCHSSLPSKPQITSQDSTMAPNHPANTGQIDPPNPELGNDLRCIASSLRSVPKRYKTMILNMLPLFANIYSSGIESEMCQQKMIHLRQELSMLATRNPSCVAPNFDLNSIFGDHLRTRTIPSDEEISGFIIEGVSLKDLHKHPLYSSTVGVQRLLAHLQSTEVRRIMPEQELFQTSSTPAAVDTSNVDPKTIPASILSPTAERIPESLPTMKRSPPVSVFLRGYAKAAFQRICASSRHIGAWHCRGYSPTCGAHWSRPLRWGRAVSDIVDACFHRR